ncbi:transglutaminase domain protein [Zopfochytrium polystomum]|nr:transglutaminase domain protein [Zopfochytrium polystomum]
MAAASFKALDRRPALDFFRQHSVLTDPGKHAGLFSDLPDDVPGLARVVQGLPIHPSTGNLRSHGIGADQEAQLDNTVFGLRRVEDLLDRVVRRDPTWPLTTLTTPRPPIERVGAICRNFAVLLVAMLRHKGVPARARVGFAGYFRGRLWYDHRIAEYWSAESERWVLVDPQMDETSVSDLGICFEVCDMRDADPYLRAGDVWRRCRLGQADPQGFGDNDADVGMLPIRYALLQDWAYLNKCELLGCDDWGDLITTKEADLTDADVALLDRVADLTANVDANLDELRFFRGSEYGNTVLQKMKNCEL